MTGPQEKPSAIPAVLGLTKCFIPNCPCSLPKAVDKKPRVTTSIFSPEKPWRPGEKPAGAP